jgi:elongation factor 1 alpha-like protein
VRDIISPLRFPVSNVFKRQTAGAAVSGRLCGGLVQVGEKLRVLPGDETAVVKCEDALSRLFALSFSLLSKPLNLRKISLHGQPQAQMWSLI